jgi:hypothetical protein
MADIIYTIEKHQALFIIIFTAVLAWANIFLWLATRKLWSQTERASQGAIILQANRDLFFHERMYKVRKAIESKKPIFESKGGQCSVQDVEDYIGYFDTLYDFMKSKILNIKMTNDNFGYYVEEAYKNEEVKNYISGLRTELGDEELYNGFENWAKNKLPKS